MAKTIVKITSKIYNNPDNGQVIPYERLAIIGTINGDPYTLELKLLPSELQLAKALLASTEDLNVQSRTANSEESEEFVNKNSGRTGNVKIN